MHSSLRTQTAAFSLAALITLGLTASINQLAALPAPLEPVAQTESAPAQVVVITAKRNQV